jgi:hypothetical protein
MCRQCIKTSDRFAIGGEDEDGGQLPFQILPRLSLQIHVQSWNTTGESRSIMMRFERLDRVFDS